jgi:hypothetical protein
MRADLGFELVGRHPGSHVVVSATPCIMDEQTESKLQIIVGSLALRRSTHLKRPPLALTSKATRIGTGMNARKVAPQMA